MRGRRREPSRRVYRTPCASTRCGVGIRDTNSVCHWIKEKEKNSSSNDGAIIAGVAAAAALLLAVAAFWFYRRNKGSETEPSGGSDSPPEPKLEPLEQPGEEATVLAVALEAEEILAEQPAAAKGWFSIGWFAAAEPEGEPESAPFPPEAEGTVAAAEEPPPLADWERKMNASEAAAEQGTGFQMPSALEGELEPEC